MLWTCLFYLRHSPCCPTWGLIWLQEDSISLVAKQCKWSQHWFSFHADAGFQRQMQAVVSREQLFSSGVLFSAQFHKNYVILSCFQGAGNVSHSSTVDLPIWHNLCSHDFPARILWFFVQNIQDSLQAPASWYLPRKTVVSEIMPASS